VIASSSSLNDAVDEQDVEPRDVLARRSKIGRREPLVWGRSGPADGCQVSDDMVQTTADGGVGWMWVDEKCKMRMRIARRPLAGIY